MRPYFVLWSLFYWLALANIFLMKVGSNQVFQILVSAWRNFDARELSCTQTRWAL